MKNKKLILLIVLSAFFLGCNNEVEELNEQHEEEVKFVVINPMDELKDVDNLLSQLADKPQYYSTPSNSATIVKGEKGTVIHVDPNSLETVDGSPLGQNLDVELVEMVDMESLMFNNTQTVSNGEIIETGGAYYLNMTSDGKQLKMKAGKGVKVEFPIISKKDMEVFMGDRDSLGQVNWNATQKDFEPKKTPKAKYSGPTIIIANGMLDTMSLTGKELIEWEKQTKKNEQERKTYKAIDVMLFGLINVDRFLNDPSPKTNIELIVKSDNEITGARIYAIFSEVNALATASYWNGQKYVPSFNEVPVGKEVQLIAIAANGEKSYIFEKTINISENMSVQIDFQKTTQEEIKEIAKGLRKID